jgi:hypothetical protein
MIRFDVLALCIDIKHHIYNYLCLLIIYSVGACVSPTFSFPAALKPVFYFKNLKLHGSLLYES